jgi:glycerol uptake facilitator-like aquaporin
MHSPGGYNLMASFVAEVVLTFFLVFTVLGSTDLKAPVGFAGIPIEIVLVLIHLVRIPVTNPFGQPGTQHRTGIIRRRLGACPAVVVHRRAFDWRGYSCGLVSIDWS